jgi:glycyl-tRNA synthetase beta chain
VTASKLEIRNSKLETGSAVAVEEQPEILNRQSSNTIPLLLEVGCEEIPARFLRDAERSLGDSLQKALRNDARLFGQDEPGIVETYSTPRRIVAHVPSLLIRQPDILQRVLGPPVKVAFDHEGRPTRAAEAFASKHNVDVSSLHRMQHGKGEYLYLDWNWPGSMAHDILVELLPMVIKGLIFPKSMYWTSKSDTRFVRPIRWVLAILGEGQQARTVNFEILGVKSGDFTFSHRAKSGKALRVKDFKDYARKLAQHFVEIDYNRRCACVIEGAQTVVGEAGGKVVQDEWLTDWIANSTEWPRPMLGSFDERFLHLPREILITVMRDHQRYFALEDEQGNLRPHFVAVLNMDSDEKGLIRQGHQRVLTARFRDAEFFWNADQKTPLRSRGPLLDKVTYQAKLGSYGDKIRRVKAIAGNICISLEDSGLMTPGQTLEVLRAVELCKYDLTTQMVQEFTELQGIVGGLYAREQGEPPEVADAIYDHYLPQGAEDECPRSLVGAVVSLADKIDSVTAGFQVGLGPTGSSDPFALRRAGNGIVKLAVEVLAGLDLTILTNQIFHAQAASAGAQAVLGSGSLSQNVDNFLRERMEFYFRETAGLRYDTVRAVLRPTRILQDLVPSAALSRARAIERVRDTEDFMALASAAKRTRNIRKSAGVFDILGGRADPALFVEQPERDLYEAYQSLSQRIEQLGDSGDFEEAFRMMATIRPQVDRFFDNVLVMTEDATLRRNRLMLLLRLNEDVFTSLADLAEIVVDPRSGAAAWK